MCEILRSRSWDLCIFVWQSMEMARNETVRSWKKRHKNAENVRSKRGLAEWVMQNDSVRHTKYISLRIDCKCSCTSASLQAKRCWRSCEPPYQKCTTPIGKKISCALVKNVAVWREQKRRREAASSRSVKWVILLTSGSFGQKAMNVAAGGCNKNTQTPKMVCKAFRANYVVSE